MIPMYPVPDANLTIGDQSHQVPDAKAKIGYHHISIISISAKLKILKCPRAKKCDLITLSKLYIGTITLLKMPFITSWKFNHFVSKLDLK